MSKKEQQLKKQQNHWDEGAIDEFMHNNSNSGIELKLNNKNRLIFFATPEDMSNETKTQTIANQTDLILEWLGCSDITVNLWWRDDPRLLDSTEWPTRRNVNGGWTTIGHNEVFVYRSEEWDRVLIHEMIHAMEWDWKHMPTTPLSCWNFKKTDIVSPSIFEAWTELYAEWLWCAFHNIDWDIQRNYQEKQALQIIARSNERNGDWKENTNVFAYYILKTALAPHIEFLWMFGNGKTADERAMVLCGLVEPELTRLRKKASYDNGIVPEKISLRMTVSI